MTEPCTLYEVFSINADGSESSEWDCESYNGRLVAIPAHLELELELREAVSGETTVYAPGMAIVDGRLDIPVVSEIVYGYNPHRQNRQLLATSGNVQVLAIRVTCDNSAPMADIATISTEIFGSGNTLKNLANQCSNGDLTISEASYTNVIDGTIDVDVGSSVDCNKFLEVTAAVDDIVEEMTEVRPVSDDATRGWSKFMIG